MSTTYPTLENFVNDLNSNYAQDSITSDTLIKEIFESPEDFFSQCCEIAFENNPRTLYLDIRSFILDENREVGFDLSWCTNNMELTIIGQYTYQNYFDFEDKSVGEFYTILLNDIQYVESKLKTINIS